LEEFYGVEWVLEVRLEKFYGVEWVLEVRLEKGNTQTHPQGGDS
jgi:hypothetical protein